MRRGVQSWKIGAVTVTKIVELSLRISPRFLLPEATPEALEPLRSWLAPRFLGRDGRIVLSIHSFLVESQGLRILVDTCIGNDKPRPVFPEWDRRRGPFLRDLEAAGFPRESVQRVVCTHLHVDHVGWNTTLEKDRWVPTFPHARYLIGRREWEFWRSEKDDLSRAVLEDSVQPIVDSGLADLVRSDHAITDEVRLVPTPGHTPGHASVAISSRGEEAVITGDMLHHPAQCARPEWKDNFDVDHELARSTRTAFLERHADRPALVLGTHFPQPTAGRIRRDAGAWRFET
jgi:glyoxylase-like metal-dependent hydrolase (beta-lactamase superfamily II)